MKTIRVVILVVMLPILMMAAGCEGDHRGWRADFSNTSTTDVDVFRNGDLQFTLAPNAGGDCRVELDDDFAVRVHATGQVLGSYHVDGWGSVYDVRVTAMIFDDHVDWSTDFDGDDW
ncbi:MAG: hypothetical protein NTY53_04710 [Kiritimatiellaeota bacterium]|nr:hypothetical protein [Kiritimatiellota bacterium]